MKSIFTFFLFTLSAISFGQTAAELEQQIETLLRNQHHYQGNGFANSFSSRVGGIAYLEGLKKFKQALDKTRHVRNFKNIGNLYISSEEKIEYYEDEKNQTLHLYFPASGPFESFIPLISKDSDNEPIYQKSLKEVREKLDRRLKQKFGPWYEFHKTGQKILCQHDWTASNSQDEVESAIKRAFAKKVKSVSHKKYDLDFKEMSRELTVEFESPPPLQVRIVTHFSKNAQHKDSYVIVENKAKGFHYKKDKLVSSRFNSDCHFRDGNIWEYNSRGLLSRRQWLDANGKVRRTVFVNRAIKSLLEIYVPCGYYRPFSELQYIANRMDRILVTILDTGVDYNHPDLAFKIPRPSLGSSNVIGVVLESEKKRLKKEYNNFWPIQRWLYQNGYEATINSVSDQIRKAGAIGWDYNDDDDQPYDYDDYILNILENFDHGTHVAGIASWGSDDIAILPIRYPPQKPKRFYDAIELAHKRGSRIVNISLSNDSRKHFESLEKAIQDHPDMLFVVSSGNHGQNLGERPTYPAAYDHPNMIVVASVDYHNKLSKFSNYSQTKVHVAAPGEHIYSLMPENSYGQMSGTSMSTPYVTRIAAKIKFINPSFTPKQIIAIIKNSVTPVDSLKDKVKYGGVVNEEKAIRMAKETRLVSDNVN